MFFLNSGDKAERYFYYMSIQHYTELFKMKEKRRKGGRREGGGKEGGGGRSQEHLPHGRGFLDNTECRQDRRDASGALRSEFRGFKVFILSGLTSPSLWKN